MKIWLFKQGTFLFYLEPYFIDLDFLSSSQPEERVILFKRFLKITIYHRSVIYWNYIQKEDKHDLSDFLFKSNPSYMLPCVNVFFRAFLCLLLKKLWFKTCRAKRCWRQAWRPAPPRLPVPPPTARTSYLTTCLSVSQSSLKSKTSWCAQPHGTSMGSRLATPSSSGWSPTHPRTSTPSGFRRVDVLLLL